MRYIHYDDTTLQFKHFYINRLNVEEFSVPTPFLKIDEELWDYLHTLQEDFKIKDTLILKELYTIEDKDIFEIIPFVYDTPKPSRMDFIEEQNAQMIMDLALKDDTLETLSTDNAQLIIDSAMKDAKVEELEQTVSQLILEIAKGGN